MRKVLTSSTIALLGSITLVGCGSFHRQASSPATTHSPNDPPVVTQALNWIAQHRRSITSLHGTAALQGPRILPGHGPYAATVELQPVINSYYVALWETTKPMAVNQFNPNQLTNANGTPHYVSALRVQQALARWAVYWQPLSSHHLVPPMGIAGNYGFVQPLGSGRRVRLPHGLTGMLYTRGTDPGGTVGNTVSGDFVLWHEDQWSLETVGAHAVAEADTMVHAIHLNQLPRAQSGFVVWTNHTQSLKTTSIFSTSLTWYQHPYVVNFSTSTPGSSNLESALTMVDSWRTGSPHPK